MTGEGDVMEEKELDGFHKKLGGQAASDGKLQ